MSAAAASVPPAGAARAGASGPPAGGGATPARGAADHSREAKQRAAAVLEGLAGVRTPAQAAQALGVSLSRYYLLEERALAGLVAACEPQPRGPGVEAARRVAALEQECQRWQRECARQQALVRAAQRTIGLAAPAPPPAKDKGKKRRQRRPVARALHAAARLQAEEEKPAAGASPAAAPGP